MLVAGRGRSLGLVRCFHPVPATVTVPAEAPRVSEGTLVGSATTEGDHHTSGGTREAQSRRVVHTGWWLVLTAIEFVPAERSALDTQTPNIVDGLLSSVTTEDQKVRLAENDSVTVSAAGGATDHWHNHPLGHRLTITHIKQVQIVRGQGTSTCSSCIHDHLHLFDIGR